MSEDNRIVKSMELYRNGNVKRIEFYEPTQQPQFISSVFGSPQGTAKTYEMASGPYTTTGSNCEAAMNDSNEELYEHEIVSSGILSGGGELYSIAGDAKICYICGNKCEVMQSMMHAYTEIQVCGDCMLEHLYPFIETVKKIESEVKRD